MKILKRSWLAAAMIVPAIMVAGALAVPKTASAEPVSPRSNQPYSYMTISKTSSDFLKRAQQVTSANHSVILDYRHVTHYFWSNGNHRDWGRKFAAGWLQRHSISHISSAELANVKRVGRAAGVHFDAVTPLSTCTGQSKKTDHSTKAITEKWLYLDSCQTTKLISDRGYTSPWIGIVGGLLAPWSAPAGTIMGIFIAVYGNTTTRLSAAQSASDVNAIIIKSRDYGINYTNGTRYTHWRVDSQ